MTSININVVRDTVLLLLLYFPISTSCSLWALPTTFTCSLNLRLSLDRVSRSCLMPSTLLSMHWILFSTCVSLDFVKDKKKSGCIFKDDFWHSEKVGFLSVEDIYKPANESGQLVSLFPRMGTPVIYLTELKVVLMFVIINFLFKVLLQLLDKLLLLSDLRAIRERENLKWLV